jgi:DNA-binding transcriptional ArsR family regulator
VREDELKNGSLAPLSPELLQEGAGLFGLLASSARLQIVWMLAYGEQDVGTLADAVGLALPAVSQHLTKLRIAGVVDSRREGRRQVYALNDSRVGEAVREVIGGLVSPRLAHGPVRRRLGR